MRSILFGLAASGLCVCAAQAQDSGAPPYPPSSFELRRLEQQVRDVVIERAKQARLKSRQVELTGTGNAEAGGAALSERLDFDVTPKLALQLSMTGLFVVSAIAAVSEDTEPGAGFGGGNNGNASVGTTTGGGGSAGAAASATGSSP